MRAFGNVILAALASCLLGGVLIAGMVYLRLGIQLGPYPEFEFTVIMMGEVVTALGTAVILAVVLAVGGTESAVRRTALVLAVLLVTALAGLEVFGLVTQGTAALSASNAFAEDAPFLVAVAIPGLQRHGIGRLPDVEGEKPAKKTFKTYAIKGDTGEPLFDGGATAESMTGLRHFQTLIAAENRLYVAADDAVYAFSF